MLMVQLCQVFFRAWDFFTSTFLQPILVALIQWHWPVNRICANSPPLKHCPRVVSSRPSHNRNCLCSRFWYILTDTSVNISLLLMVFTCAASIFQLLCFCNFLVCGLPSQFDHLHSPHVDHLSHCLILHLLCFTLFGSFSVTFSSLRTFPSSLTVFIFMFSIL